MTEVYDKNGVPIRKGDIVKVYHFTGPHRKRYYMYKQCVGVTRFLPSGGAVMSFSHLDFGETNDYEEYGHVLRDYQVVQGAFDDYDQRDRLK